jgi:hypothetical protein
MITVKGGISIQRDTKPATDAYSSVRDRRRSTRLVQPAVLDRS